MKSVRQRGQSKTKWKMRVKKSICRSVKFLREGGVPFTNMHPFFRLKNSKAVNSVSFAF